MDITQLRHEAERAELKAAENRRLAENYESQASSYENDSPDKSQMRLNDALRFRREADELDKQAAVYHAEMDQKKSQAEQLRQERLRVQAEYEEKIRQIDTQIKDIEGAIF